MVLSESCKCQDSTFSSTYGFSKKTFAFALEKAKVFQFNQADAKKDLIELTKEPHPLGSLRQKQIASYLASRAREYGLDTYEEVFTADTPNPNLNSPSIIQKTGINVFIKPKFSNEKNCTILIGSHYDTKFLPHTPYVGANDSGSSSVLLLQLIKYINDLSQKDSSLLTCNVVGVFFDGEEAQLLEWDDGIKKHAAKIQDNTYGSRFLSAQLSSCDFLGQKTKCLPFKHGGNALIALLLLDMVGSKNLKITKDYLSTPLLVTLLETIGSHLNLKNNFSSAHQTIFDDHVPFLQSGAFALDIIDFYHLDNWHREGDDISNISFESIELAGKLTIPLFFILSIEPKVFLAHADHK